jgi:adenine-specific DNA-methyltransferase
MAVSIPKSKSNGSVIELNGKEKIEFVANYVNGENRLYYGDNLDVLKQLTYELSVCGKVKLIYIDPPYSTGGVFQTRDLKDAYSDVLLGNEYLAFMQKRLELLHQLLSEQGSIYVHLDSKMVFHIKIMLDIIFGENNFQGMITRKKCKPKNYTRKTFGNVSDYILFYTKSDNPTWNRPYDEWTDERILKEYPFIEEKTGRRYKKVPIHAPGIRNGLTGQEWRGMMPPAGKHWQFVPTTLDEFDAKGEIYWSSTGNPRRKVFLENSKGIPVQDIWLDYLDINNQNTKGTGYPTEKNPDLLKRVIEASSDKGDLILDCFAGSGTTLAAADELNRKWIGIDSSEEAINTILDRFYRGISPLGDFAEKKENNKGSFNLFDTPSIRAVKNEKIIHDFSFYTEKYNAEPFEEKINKIKTKKVWKS